ncbi:T9SS type B sorting domain-containing protein [Flagellimonas sp. HMM57]|uniref:T9SS type B sorting domain-containing protein n=1 Tax=unclassified Flagellimonas TaxID=2644544 RepID=UPI0013D1F8EF|nr:MULTISPECIES: T9SS type B sorting domain-containing protein [unclassified Flagellimonas]UII75048.1 T9SS type B sorting domain-containing protein [Flagellimonas sp. HMM57]
MVKSFIRIIFLVLLCQITRSQVLPDCANAVPICSNTPINGGANGYGIDDFDGTSSSGCLERTLSGFIESNSAWYRFRTGASGQLGFNIGHDSTEDWDFALYRASDCNNLGEPVRCNFFDNSDFKTFLGVGEDPTGDVNSVHYEDWLDVNVGEEYYLLINNFSNVNSGFSIQFTGDILVTDPMNALDCSIVDNLLGPPIAACENETVVLDATTTGATNYEWYSDNGTGFQLLAAASGSPTLQILNSAMYRVVVSTPTGSLISDVQVAFNVIPTTTSITDEILCYTANLEVDLELKDFEALGTQNPDDFIVSYHSSQADANQGINPFPKTYPKSLGSETIYVRTTSLANPNCYDASESFVLNTIETPELTFPEEVIICEDNNGVVIGKTVPNPSHSYQWSTGEQTPNIIISQDGDYTLTVTNSLNGMFCSESRTVRVQTSVLPVISDIEIEDFSSSNTVTIVTEAVGEFEYRLNDGTFQTGNVFEEVPAGVHTVTMRDVFGCGEVVENIVVVGFLAIFSPNGDVLNETWHVEGLSELNSPVVTIYDRYGKLLKELTEFSPGWDGNFDGRPLPSTDYWFKLSYLDENGNRMNAKYLRNHFSLRR